MAVQSGNRDGVTYAQRIELPESLLLAVGIVELVDEQEGGLLCALDHARNALVFFGDADGTIDNEEDDVGFFCGGKSLVANRGREDILAFHGLDAARVYERELMTTPIGVVIGAVSRNATAFVDDGVRGLGDAIDEGGFTDIRTTDNRNDGLHMYLLADGTWIRGRALCKVLAAGLSASWRQRKPVLPAIRARGLTGLDDTRQASWHQR